MASKAGAILPPDLSARARGGFHACTTSGDIGGNRRDCFLEALQGSAQHHHVLDQTDPADEDSCCGDEADDEPDRDPGGHAGNASAAARSGAFAAPCQELTDVVVVLQHEVEFDHIIDAEHRASGAGEFALFMVEEGPREPWILAT